MWYQWKPYVPVAARRNQARREMDKLRKKGQVVSPVVIEGRTIARTFWGKAWCENLERYSDFENRLPRGRTYVRNGSVLDLQIAPAEVKALVSGSSIYKVTIKVSAVPKARWSSICRDCAGGIDSLVELLQGRFSKGVMERMCRDKTGLFPAPTEIQFSCSCPDWASMCKHVAAVFYGIGARLDQAPQLLFGLRKVDEKDLIAEAGRAIPLSRTGPAAGKLLAADGLSELFGLDMDTAPDASNVTAAAAPKRRGRRREVVRPVGGAASKATARGPRPSARRNGSKPASKAKAKRRGPASDERVGTRRPPVPRRRA